MSMPLAAASAIFYLCSLDTRVARRVAQLILNCYGAHLISPAAVASLRQDCSPSPRRRSLTT